MRLRTFVTALSIVLAARCGFVQAAFAQDSNSSDQPQLIRDAEIEGIIRTWWTPILHAASLDPQAVHIYIVEDPEINSFVAGGQNLFLNTGLLLRSQSPNQVVGIMAHETGHIAGGHLVRSDRAMTKAVIASIIAMAAGLAAGVAGHDSNAAAAGVLGGAELGERNFMAFSVGQEASADHAAMSFLDHSHQSARGLLQFFEMLQQDEMLAGQKEDPYLRDHPLTQDRINYVRDHVEHSQWSDAKDPPEWIVMHQLMKAKLDAFMNAPAQVLGRYKADDQSIPARYARAVAYYRIPELKQALALVDGLIAAEPHNPYFQELKGQMLFENGRVADAVQPYQQAVALAPDSALLKIEAAQVELECRGREAGAGGDGPAQRGGSLRRRQSRSVAVPCDRLRPHRQHGHGGARARRAEHGGGQLEGGPSGGGARHQDPAAGRAAPARPGHRRRRDALARARRLTAAGAFMRLRTLVLVVLALAVAALPAAADPLTPEQKDAVEQLIRNTIAEHPEIVIDALKAAQAKNDAQTAETVKKAIAAEHDQLVADPSSPVGGNPKGDVTIVEFFDYRCPYCKEVEPSLEALVKNDRGIRFVYKEFPILGPASVYAAHVALAARAQGKYDEFHRAMMAVKGTIDEGVVRRTAAAVGIDMKELDGAIAAPEIDGIIKANYALAEALEIDGTPAFVIGDYLLPGVPNADTLRKIVAEIRKGG